VIIAETGLDMARFPTAAHLASWAKFAPGVKESASSHRCGRRSVSDHVFRDRSQLHSTRPTTSVKDQAKGPGDAALKQHALQRPLTSPWSKSSSARQGAAI
jgi:hypothetical protein